MKTLAELGIVPLEGTRAHCPLCQQDDCLTIIPHEGQHLFNCLNCGQNGSTALGWFDDRLEEGYITVDHLGPAIDSIYEKGLQHGISTGWFDLDDFFSLRKGEVTIIGGIPGHGKSTWLTNLSINAGHFHKWKWAVYSPEMEPYELYTALAIEKFSGQKFFPNYPERISRENLEKAKAWLNDRFFFLNPTKNSLYDILERAAYLVRKKQLDALIIDPWNRLENTMPPGMREDQFISMCMDRLTNFAKKNKICVFLVVHPAKMKAVITKDGRPGPEPVPSVFDLKGASEWNAKADNILCVYRDRSKLENNFVEIHAQKIRWHLTGHDGSMELEFIPDSRRYKQIGTTDRPPIMDAQEMNK